MPLTDAKRKKRGLPKTCECGGKMLYEADFGRLFSWCESCTPVRHVSVRQLRKVTH